MKVLKVLFLTFLITAQCYAKGKFKVEVSLFPAGSFEILGQIYGKVKKKKNKFFIKNAYIKVSKIKTGLDLRDKHTKEKLEYKKYKKIFITKAFGKNNKGQLILLIKNIKKKVGFKYQIKGKKIILKFSLNLKDFNFSGLSYMGVGVEDKIFVNAQLNIE